MRVAVVVPAAVPASLPQEHSGGPVRSCGCCRTTTSPSCQVFLSTRRGTWVLHRVADGGYPFDFSYISRFIQLVRSLLPHNASSLFLERKLNTRFNHALYGLQPQHR